MRKRILIFAGLAMALSSGAALAANPSHPTHPTTPASTNSNKGTTNGQSAKVLFVLHGTIGSYMAAAGMTNGSISITLKSSNFETTALKAATQPISFVVSSKTKVQLHKGKTVASGDKATIKVRAPKNSTASALSALTAFQVVDSGSA